MASVYVIASYDSAPAVRLLHTRIRMAGHEPTSSWAESARGPENLPAMSFAAKCAAWDRNTADMSDADTVIVLADTPMREGFMEAQRAVDGGRHAVLWVGRDTLTSSVIETTRMTHFADIDSALRALEVQP